MGKRNLYLVLLPVLCLSFSICNGQLVYSLDDDHIHVKRTEKELAAAGNDSMRAMLNLRLSFFCRLTGDTAKANAYLKTGVALSRGYPFLKAASSYYEVLALFASGNLPVIEKKLHETDSALRPFDTKTAARFQSMVWQNLGAIEQLRGNEKGAMDIFINKAIVYAEKSENLISKGGTYKSVGLIFFNAREWRKAAGYLLKAVTYIEQSLPEYPTRLEDLAEASIIAAENYVFMARPDSAKLMLDKAKMIIAPQPRSNLFLSYYRSEGVYFDTTGNYAAAIESFNKGLALGGGPREANLVNRLKSGKYKTLLKMKKYREAIAVISELQTSPMLFAADRKMYYKDLFKTYALLNDTREAFNWAEKYIELSDSVYKQQVEKDIAELEQKYNNAEKEKTITMLQAQKDKAALSAKNNRLLSWLLGGASVFLLAVALLLVLYSRSKKKLLEQKEFSYQQQLREAEQQRQIQCTQALLQGEERERKRLAGDLHDGLGGMIAGVKINLSQLMNNQPSQNTTAELERVIHQLDNSVNELRRIARNMMPDTLVNLGLEPALKDLCASMQTSLHQVHFQAFDLGADIPQQTQINIYRIVQELLTNAIKHAQAARVLVQCSQNGHTFFITVEDNGKGFDVNAAKSGNGLGLANIQNRVDYLKGKLEVVSAPGEGCTVNIELNVTAEG